MRTKARTIQNQRRSEGQRTFLEGQTQQSTKNGPLPEKEPSLTRFVFSSFSGLLPHATCLHESTWKDENILFISISLVCHDRTQARPHHEGKTVFSTPITGRIQDSKLLFPFLRSAALLSRHHTAAVGTSAERHSPSGHRPVPDLSPCRAEPPRPHPRSQPPKMERLRGLLLDEAYTLKAPETL